MYDTPDETHTGLCHDLYLPGYGAPEPIDGQWRRLRNSSGRHAQPVSVCPRYDMPSQADGDQPPISSIW